MKTYPFGLPITKDRIQDEDWYYDEYQPFLEFLLGYDEEVSAETLQKEYLAFHKKLMGEDYSENMENLEKFCKYHASVMGDCIEATKQYKGR